MILYQVESSDLGNRFNYFFDFNAIEEELEEICIWLNENTFNHNSTIKKYSLSSWIFISI